MWEYNHTCELYHHGIKGMKWGVRRFRNKDGSLTAAGRKRYSEDDHPSKTKSKRQLKLEAKYRSDGYSDDEATKLATSRMKTERVLIAIGAVGVTSAAAIAAYKYYDKRLDRFIKPGQMMQTVHLDDAKSRINSGNPFYASYKKSDNTIFSSRYNGFMKDKSKITKFYADRGIKVASEDSGRKAFEHLSRVNPEFKRYADSIPKYGQKDSYKVFNGNLAVRATAEEVKYNKIFYDELKKRGYGGVIDTNDTGWSFSPVVIFDDSTKRITSSTKVTSKDLGVGKRLKAELYATIRGDLTDPIGALVKTAYVGEAYVVGKILKNNFGKDEFIKRYKREHPNTKLTDAQIAKLDEV